MVKITSFRPTLACLKNAEPLDSNRIIIINGKIIDRAKGAVKSAKQISINRFTKAPVSFTITLCLNASKT